MQVEIRRMNNDFHQFQNYQKINEYQFINSMFFGAKKKETTKIDDTSSKDLELVTKMNQEFATSLDLNDTLQTALEVIIKRINAQAANIFLIEDSAQSLGCKIILGGKGQNTYQQLSNYLDEGYHVCLLADRHVGKSGIGVEFFNQLAAFPKGPVSLSLEKQVPIIPATFLKIDNKYKLVFGKPFIVPHFENDAQSIQHGLKVLSKELEKLILLDPNQWHSIQPVWTSEY